MTELNPLELDALKLQIVNLADAVRQLAHADKEMFAAAGDRFDKQHASLEALVELTAEVAAAAANLDVRLTQLARAAGSLDSRLTKLEDQHRTRKDRRHGEPS